MNKLFLFFILIGFFLSKANGQSWTDAEFRKANTAANATYLTNEEKNIIMYMNLIRIDGEKFYYTFLEDYINNYNAMVKKYSNYNQLKITRTNSYYTSLLKHLRVVKNLQMFYPDEKLSILSKTHAQDLNKNNIGTHESSNGDSFSKRLSKHFPNKTMSENIDFGYSNSLDIVCHLLLDCGVPSLGHRFNILDQKNKLNTVGVGIQRHPSYTWCAVIDFVAQPMFYTSNQ
ncbi:CAP domain-containing protein [Pedobacter chinensis]|uniref:CAP domain-containing protein n=1 Tax=Pedobacter chinensis TaxID=2282421 RepID=A0A369PZI8_9SPHI|nr:CAP domain-containing protein [Pedobacter chinensis]RDC55488.1 CAP domain-containing protein [Pedobacter chinensis]